MTVRWLCYRAAVSSARYESREAYAGSMNLDLENVLAESATSRVLGICSHADAHGSVGLERMSKEKHANAVEGPPLQISWPGRRC